MKKQRQQVEFMPRVRNDRILEGPTAELKGKLNLKLENRCLNENLILTQWIEDMLLVAKSN